MPLGSRFPIPNSHKRNIRKVIPHKSGVHRVACFALYKRLLQQVPHSPLSQTLLRTVLQKEFRKDARIRGHAGICQSLTTGYKTLHLLESLRGQPSTSEEVSSLNDYLHTLSQSYPIPKPKPPPPARPCLTPYPNGNKILDRPLPTSALSGRRCVPKLVSANGFPMLRIKKPQPPLISKILRDKIKQRQRRGDAVVYMEEEILPWSKDEDVWDARMRMLGARDGSDEGEGSYTETAQGCIQHVYDLLQGETSRQSELAKKMWWIVLRERALAEKERKEREKAKVDAWLAHVRKSVESRGLVWEDRSRKSAVRQHSE